MNDKVKTNSKIDIKLGNLSFSGEGEQDWLADQLQKVIAAAGSVNEPQIRSTHHNHQKASLGDEDLTNMPLASYLKRQNAERSQLMRFLVTADWLERRGTTNLTTAAVAKALADNHQSRLANPSDCLNKNVSKGLCEKKGGGGFFITPVGKGELRHD